MLNGVDRKARKEVEEPEHQRAGENEQKVIPQRERKGWSNKKGTKAKQGTVKMESREISQVVLNNECFFNFGI